MELTPCIRYRPGKVSDGEGGYTESYQAPVTMYVGTVLDKEELKVSLDASEDIRAGDVLAFDEPI